MPVNTQDSRQEPDPVVAPARPVRPSRRSASTISCSRMQANSRARPFDDVKYCDHWQIRRQPEASLMASCLTFEISTSHKRTIPTVWGSVRTADHRLCPGVMSAVCAVPHRSRCAR